MGGVVACMAGCTEKQQRLHKARAAEQAASTRLKALETQQASYRKERTELEKQITAAIAKASPPVSSVEKFLKALSGCDLATAKSLLSASVLAKIAEKLADEKQSESDGWQDFCKSFAANKEPLRATAGEIKDNRATVKLEGRYAGDEVALIFETGQWKLTQRSNLVDQTYWASPLR
jgi:hypothetical protein